MNILPTTVFAALSHETRVRCVLLLREQGELCVCELTAITASAQPNVSRHLRHLREAGLVLDRRDGLWIHYRINPDLPTWVDELLASTAGGVARCEPYVTDRRALHHRAHDQGHCVTRPADNEPYRGSE